MNPFIAFCLYVAARVFVQYLKARKDDSTVISSLQFLLSAMHALKGKNPLTGSFLLQLEVDLEGTGLRLPYTSGWQNSMPLQSTSGTATCASANSNRANCSPLFDLPLPNKQQQAEAANQDTHIPWMATTGSSNDFSDTPHVPRQSYNGSFPDRSRDATRQPAVDQNSGERTSPYGESCVLDIEVSYENMSSQSFPTQPNSDRPTPSASPNNTSSQNSFSPPQLDGHPNLTSGSSFPIMSPHVGSTSNVFTHQHTFQTFDSSLPNRRKPSAPEGGQSLFGMPASWNNVDDRMTSGDTPEDFDLTGINEGGTSSWQPTNVMERSSWLFSEWNGTHGMN